MKTRVNQLYSTLIFLVCLTTLSFGQKSITWEQEKENFNSVANYLSNGTGKWTGINDKYDGNNPRSPKAFGLWFAKPLNNLLTLSIVAYLGDSTILSSQAYFMEHPTEKKYMYVSADRGNGIAEGVTTFPDTSTFISVVKIIRPDGNIYDHKDDNFLSGENEHRNSSFKKNDQGEWEKTGEWIWTRDIK